MKCDMEYCIYWKNYRCILKKISIDSAAHCMECIMVSLDEKTLKQKRKELLDKYQSEENW